VCEGDKKAEEEVDECLLIPFRHCLRWNIDEQSSSSEKHNRHHIGVTVDIKQVFVTMMTMIKPNCEQSECFP